MSCQLHVSGALPPRKSLHYPLIGRVGGPHSQSRCFGEDKISLISVVIAQV